jgi:hypothetical protein
MSYPYAHILDTTHTVSVSQRSAATLRAQAATYRHMADSAHTLLSLEGLNRVADRYEALAEKREQQEVDRG